MTKDALIQAVANHNGQLQKDIRTTLDSLMDVLIETLASGEPVRLVGFGEFRVSHRKERPYRHPSTGETILAPATRSVSFVEGDRLRRAVRE